ncbi:hypothetical protein [Leptospira levettii]|uniref:Uncharacterized protein n=1 Tax=Leptospira levettii TaxID=2023178 RepID=A0AAW5V7U9_9LEPT|nr:hypothetical protein [Leptospira levettii]MCW7512099.1 hypothetical protein [Leptospira levettii]MCW7517162.1 hypothetical protein [Leptospira levettii]
MILDLMQSMLEVGEDPPSITILGKKIINLNGVDLGESVQANVVNIRDTLEAGISILEGIQTQPFFPNFHKEIIVKIQKVVLHIDDLSRDLLARFQSYEIVLI